MAGMSSADEPYVRERPLLASAWRAFQTRQQHELADADEIVLIPTAEFAWPGTQPSADVTRKADRRRRMMIVDDHRLVRDAIRRAFTGSDVDVVAEASSAQEALDAVAAARPDLVLLDVDLRGAPGTEIIGELKRRAPQARVVMLTVSSASDDVDQAMRNGASGYLTKDVSSEALVRAVRGALEGDLAMSRRMALQYVERTAAPDAPRHEDPAFDSLTSRERDILRLMSEGMTSREIGEALVLSPRTVEGHVGSILRKLGARNRVDAVRAYRRR